MAADGGLPDFSVMGNQHTLAGAVAGADEDAPEADMGRAGRLTGSIVATKFYIMELLGEGGMGQVYKARHLALDKLVCVKILRPQFASNATVVTRFEREAKAASRLNHPNSIQVLDFGSFEKNGFYIVMEYIEGRDLANTLAEDWPLSELRVCHIAAQVLGALAAAHAAQVIHRDLKPENIMLQKMADDVDYVKVLDFGIAKVMAPEMPGLTRGDLVCGTPQYMSPEQATGAAVDGRSDLYAVGVVMYRMVTGFLPFEGRNPMEYLTKHASEKPMQPRLRRPDAVISPELEALILKALEKDPAKRPQTAEDFRRELLEIEAVRRVESTGTVVNAVKMGPRSAALANAPTQAPSHPTAMEELDAPTAIALEVRPSAPTSDTYTRVSSRTTHDMTNAVVAYRKAQRRTTLYRALFAAVAVLVIGGGGYFIYPELPEEYQSKPRELYDLAMAKIAELLHKNEVGDSPRPGRPHKQRRSGAAVAATAAEDPPDDSASAVPQQGKCPSGALQVSRGDDVFCIDKYEFPNQAGVAPAVWQEWTSASQSCKSRGRRLCTAEEWELACRGPKGQARSVVGTPTTPEDDCNSSGDKGPHRRIDVSGSHKACISGYGVLDMSGNAAEWTASVAADNPDQRVVMGGSAVDGVAKSGCDSESTQAASARSDTIGFRCCSEPSEQ